MSDYCRHNRPIRGPFYACAEVDSLRADIAREREARKLAEARAAELEAALQKLLDDTDPAGCECERKGWGVGRHASDCGFAAAYATALAALADPASAFAAPDDSVRLADVCQHGPRRGECRACVGADLEACMEAILRPMPAARSCADAEEAALAALSDPGAGRAAHGKKGA